MNYDDKLLKYESTEHGGKTESGLYQAEEDLACIPWKEPHCFSIRTSREKK